MASASRTSTLIPRFNEKKATQLASYVLAQAPGPYPHIALAKLMYLIDRTSLDRRGAPVTTDTYCCFSHGPIVRTIWDIVRAQASGTEETEYWTQHIEKKHPYHLEVIASPGDGELSEADETIADEIWTHHGHKPWKQVCRESQALPEYPPDKAADDTSGCSPLSIDAILVALGKTPAERETVAYRLEGLAVLENILS